MEKGIKIRPKIYEKNGKVYLDLDKYNNYIKDGTHLEIYDYGLKDLKDKEFHLVYKVEISEEYYDRHGKITSNIDHDRVEYLYSFENEKEVINEAISLLDDIKFSREKVNTINELHTLLMGVLIEDKAFEFVDLTLHSNEWIEPQLFYCKNTIVDNFEDFIGDSRLLFGEVKLDEETLKYAITHNKVEYLTNDEILDCVYKLDEYSIAELLECAIENKQLNNLTIDVVKTCLDMLDNDRISEIENIDELYVVYPQLIPHTKLEI